MPTTPPLNKGLQSRRTKRRHAANRPGGTAAASDLGGATGHPQVAGGTHTGGHSRPPRVNTATGGPKTVISMREITHGAEETKEEPPWPRIPSRGGATARRSRRS